MPRTFYLSERTVKRKTKDVLAKLGASCRAQALAEVLSAVSPDALTARREIKATRRIGVALCFVGVPVICSALARSARVCLAVLIDRLEHSG